MKKKLFQEKILKFNGVEKEQKEQLYRELIKDLIKELNETAVTEDKKIILDQIKQADRHYLEAQGMQIQTHVLFTRHGECASWEQKKFGLSPNAPISDKATAGMSKTSESTVALLSHPDESPRIIISPMIRAMQTASLLIPKDKKASISIATELSENSNAPSGLDIRSRDDFAKVSAQTPFFSIKRILFFFAKLFYGKKHFDTLESKRVDAASKIQGHNNENLSIFGEDNKIRNALDYNGNKIEDTSQLINDTQEKDLWLIGHGKNFKAFFKEIFGIKTSFQYGETKSAYKVKMEKSDPSFFTPPYSLVINQKTGEIQGKYTDVLKIITPLLKASETIHDSPTVMTNMLYTTAARPDPIPENSKISNVGISNVNAPIVTEDITESTTNEMNGPSSPRF